MTLLLLGFMAIVVVGGHSRNVGKTSVIAGLIAALPAYNWTAFKITHFGHAGHARGDVPIHGDEAAWRITQETDRSGKGDTCRYLAAGAKAAVLVETAEDRLQQAMPALQRKFAEAEDVIIESNSILEFIHPDIYVTVLDPATEDFKASARKYLERADAIVLHEGDIARWKEMAQAILAGCRLFRVLPPKYVNDELVRFVADRLKLSAGKPA